MKKIIDGKLYNTETAVEIASWSAGYPSSDSNACEEVLYRTRRGAWFLYGEGGAKTRWSKCCGSNSVCGGSGIDVLRDSEAQAWCEEHDVDADIIAKHFEVEEA